MTITSDTRLTPITTAAAVTMLTAFLLASATAAQSAWVPLTAGAPPGTEAEILFDAAASNASESFFDVFIHGYWQEDIAPGDGNVYQHIRVPGLGRFGQQGAPDLPVVRLDLAVSTTASTMNLASVTDLDPRNVSGLLVYPFTIQEQDEDLDPSEDPGPGDPDGAPEQFVRDPVIYGGPGPFPLGSGPPITIVQPVMGSIRGVAQEIYPAHWFPATGLLTISAHLRVHLAAFGATVVADAITQDRGTLAAARFQNWPDQQSGYPINALTYEARYLIVTPAEYTTTLEPFISYRKARGFAVTVITLESLAVVTCGNIRGAIDTWYQAGNPSHDHYCLLVGDADVLPMCPSPNIAMLDGDDLYGSPSDGDLDEEVYVGRLSVDDATDLANQIDKIMAYGRHKTAAHFDEALLVAHAEDAPGKYEAAHESVANAAYAVAPAFEKIYGSSLLNNNITVRSAIQDGVGLVAYRGHGSETTWWEWTLTNLDFHKNELLALTNQADNPLVVWAFDCWNNRVTYDLGNDDCLGEAWLERAGGGAVAHYGSTDVSGTAQNHELDRRMFEAVYDKGLLRHGQAIAWAEGQMAAVEPGLNSWMYMLLGDPAMRVRRQDPTGIVLVQPFEVPVCTGATCPPIVIQVQDELGQPYPGVLVSLYKPGPPGGPDDVFVNAYSNSVGLVTFNTGPADNLAAMNSTGSDPHGNEIEGVMGVVSGAWTNFGGELSGFKGKVSLLGDGPLEANTPVTLDIENAAESAPALMFISDQSNPVPFKGGTLQAFPFFLTLELITDAQGEIHLASQWPAGVQSDLELWFQVAIADGGAPSGVALTNAMRAITP